MPVSTAALPSHACRWALIAVVAFVVPGALAQQSDSVRAKAAPPAPAAAPAPDAAAQKPEAPATDSLIAPAPDLRFETLPARWAFGVGGYLPHIAASAEIGTETLPGTEINFENKLGMTPNVQSIDLLAAYRFSRRHMFSLEFFDFSRSATTTLADSFRVDTAVYHVGATINARGALQYYGFTYRYYNLAPLPVGARRRAWHRRREHLGELRN